MRFRMLVGSPDGGDPDEFVAGSIDEVCELLASYLRERLGG
jgi:hypothetical protein